MKKGTNFLNQNLFIHSGAVHVKEKQDVVNGILRSSQDDRLIFLIWGNEAALFESDVLPQGHTIKKRRFISPLIAPKTPVILNPAWRDEGSYSSGNYLLGYPRHQVAFIQIIVVRIKIMKNNLYTYYNIYYYLYKS